MKPFSVIDRARLTAGVYVSALALRSAMMGVKELNTMIPVPAPETPTTTPRGSLQFGTDRFPIDDFSPQQLADKAALGSTLRDAAHVGAANKGQTADEAVKNYSEKYRQ